MARLNSSTSADDTPAAARAWSCGSVDFAATMSFGAPLGGFVRRSRNIRGWVSFWNSFTENSKPDGVRSTQLRVVSTVGIR